MLLIAHCGWHCDRREIVTDRPTGRSTSRHTFDRRSKRIQTVPLRFLLALITLKTRSPYYQLCEKWTRWCGRMDGIPTACWPVRGRCGDAHLLWLRCTTHRQTCWTRPHINLVCKYAQAAFSEKYCMCGCSLYILILQDTPENAHILQCTLIRPLYNYYIICDGHV